MAIRKAYAKEVSVHFVTGDEKRFVSRNGLDIFIEINDNMFYVIDDDGKQYIFPTCNVLYFDAVAEKFDPDKRI